MVSLASFVRPWRAATPYDVSPSTSHVCFVQSALSCHNTPLNLWRDKAILHFYLLQSPVRVKSLLARTLITHAAPSASVAPPPTQTPSSGLSLYLLRAVVASVRDGGPFWCSPASHRKYKNHSASLTSAFYSPPIPILSQPSWRH